MKKIKLVTILLLSLMVTLGMSQAVFSAEPKPDAVYVFDGNTINDTAGGAEDIDKQISSLQPGDDLTLTFQYTNDSNSTTYWYMENNIKDTLETASDQNGGYTYTLTDNGPNGETVIFDSDAVGGNDSPSGAGQGLKAATNATGEWFFIHELAAGKSGYTTLYVALDGESETNSYMSSQGKLQVNYAVEKQPPGEDKVINKPGNTTKTGDTFNPLLAIAALTAALLAALLAILSYFRDRKDGEEA